MKERIIEYKIVNNSYPVHLASEVNRLIQEGFVPYGSPYYSEYREENVQAMVKYNNTKTV